MKIENDTANRALIVASRAQQPTQAEVELRSKILQTLFQSKEHSSSHQTDYASHKARNPNPVSGTCTWILKNTKYQHWHDTPSSRLLHLSADAGCGKSVLASFLVDTLSDALSQNKLTGQVCYFFFKDDNTVQSSAIYALRALLHQCLTARSTLPKAIIDAYRTKGDALFDQFDCLWEAFKGLTSGEGGESIICILDGLDECKEDSRRLLVTSLVNYFNEGSRDLRPFLKVIVSSRPDNFIKTSFKKLPTIRLRGNLEMEASIVDSALEVESEDTEHDVKLVIDYNLQELVDQDLISTPTKDLLYVKMLENADQTFLWISLIITLLREATIDGASQNELLTVLDDRRIDSLYSRFLARCTKDPRQEAQARRLLQIIIAAARPMTVTELDYALSIQASDKSLSDLKPKLHSSPENYIRRLCGHFIRCKSGNVYFVHQTARSFLLRQKLATYDERTSLGPFWHSIISTAAHALLGEVCLQYLFFVDFEIVPEEFGNNSWGDMTTKDRFCSSHPFFLYAASCWQSHVYQSFSDRTSLMESKAWLLCDTRTLRFWTWFYIADHRWAVKAATETSVAYYFPLGAFLRPINQLSGETSSLDQGSIVGKVQPLAWAVSEGHLTVVKILICHLAVTICTKNLSSTSKIFHHAVVACTSGNRDSHRLKIVQLLIEGGAQTCDELFDAIKQNDHARLGFLVTFGELVMPTRWSGLQQKLDSVLNYNLPKRPQAVSKEGDLTSTFLSELRSKLTKERDRLRMEEVVTSKSPSISDAEMSSQLSPFYRGKDIEGETIYPTKERDGLRMEEVVISRSPSITDSEMSFQLSLVCRGQATEGETTYPEEVSLLHTPIDLSSLPEDYQVAQNLAKYGQYDEAITMYESVLECLKVQGKQNPHYHLSKLCRKNIKEAIAALRVETETVALDSALSEVLNDDDEARRLASEGKHMGAILIYEKVLAGLYKLHGDYDYEILTCLENLAISVGNVGCLEETKDLQGFVLKGYLLRYGGYHPLTAGSLRNLGVTLSREGKCRLAVAESCFRWAAEVYTDTLGDKSSSATLCVNDLKRVESPDPALRGFRWPASLRWSASEEGLSSVAKMFEFDVELFLTRKDLEEASQRRPSGQHSSQLQIVFSRLREMGLSETSSETVESAKPSSK